MRCPEDTDCQNGQVDLSSYLHLSLSLSIIFSATVCFLPGLFAEIIFKVQVPKEDTKFSLPEYGTQSYLISFEKPQGVEWL